MGEIFGDYVGLDTQHRGRQYFLSLETGCCFTPYWRRCQFRTKQLISKARKNLMAMSRTRRNWLAALGTIWVPVVITVSGITGFWPVFGVCAAGVVWTIFLFRSDLTRITVDVPPDDRHQRPFWLILPGLAVLAFAVYPFVHLYKSIEHRPVGLTANEFAQPYLRGYSFRLVDLASSDHNIRNKTFEDCWIYGPAIMFAHDTDFREDLFIVTTPYREATADDFFIVIPEDTFVSGAIFLDHCSFLRCRFVGVQMIGPSDFVDRWKKGLSPYRPNANFPEP
jgi:hypothetical protein